MILKQNVIFQIGLKLIFVLFFFLLFLMTIPILSVFSLLYLVYVYFSWKNYEVSLIDNTLVLEYGVFSNHKEQINIDKIQKMRSSRNLVQKIFKNLGNISIETGNDLTIELENLNNYQELEAKLEELIKASKKTSSP